MKKNNLHNTPNSYFRWTRNPLFLAPFLLFLIHTIDVRSQKITINRTLKIKHSDISFKNQENNQIIRIKNWNYSNEKNTPELPVKYELVYIPNNFNFEITFNVKTKKKYKGITLPPSKQQTIDTEGIIYSDTVSNYPISNKWYSSKPIYASNIIDFRGNQLLLLCINPIQYNPLLKILLINYDIDYQIILSPKNSHTKNTQKELSLREYQLLKKWVINPENIKLSTSIREINSFSNYLIITHSNFLNSADTLALWKQECGFKTKIIYSQFWNSNQIKDSIFYYYNSSVFIPDYVCFLGDHDLIPGTEKIAPPPIPEMFATDLYYVCTGGNGDFFPDIAYGRISVSNATEAMNTIKKIIRYEKSPPQNASFYQNASHCSYYQDENFDGYDDRRFVQTSEEIRNYLQSNTNINIQRIYEAASDVNPQYWNNGLYSAGEAIPSELLKPNFAWNGNSSDIINSMNYGRLYLFHRDHGYSNATGWAHPALTSSQLPFLFNLNQLSLVISINCHSGEFSKPECFAEKMLRLNTGGCFGIFAPSFYSYSGYNDAFSLGIIDGFWDNPGIDANFTGSGGTPTPDMDNAIMTNKPGDVLIHSLIYSTLEWGFNQHTNEIMHYFGDPSTTFYKSLPDTITAYYSDTVLCNSENYFIQTQNCPSCIASLTLNQQLITSSTIINDTLTLNFQAMYGDTAYLTITGPGKRPLIRAITWYCNQAVYPPIANFSVSDTVVCNNAIIFRDESQHFPDFWEWNFGDGELSNNQNPSHIYQNPGFYNITLKVQNIHGSDSILKINQIRVLTPSKPQFSDTLLCSPSPITINSTSDQQVYWYNDAMHQHLLDSGTSIYFNYIQQNQSIFPFAINEYSNVSVGKNDNSGNGGYIFSNKKNYLIFTAYENLTISKTTIFSSASGNKIIELTDSVGNIIASKIFNFSIGQNEVPLNFQIEKGKRYRLSGPVYSNFYSNTGNIHFPYSLPGVLSIDSSSSANPLETYYYFYNWQINRSCFSVSDSLTIFVQNIDPSINPSGIFMFCPDVDSVLITSNSGMNVNWSNGDFSNSITTYQNGLFHNSFQLNECSYFSDTLNIIPYQALNASFSINCQQNDCQFINNSTAANYFEWDFGDGSFSNIENPSHVFSDTGSFHIVLKAYNNCDTGYFDQTLMIDALSVTKETAKFFKIYSNPFSEGFNIVNYTLKPYSYQIFNYQGEVINEGKSAKLNDYIRLGFIADGIYFIEIISNLEIYRIKMLKISK